MRSPHEYYGPEKKEVKLNIRVETVLGLYGAKSELRSKLVGRVGTEQLELVYLPAEENTYTER